MQAVISRALGSCLCLLAAGLAASCGYKVEVGKYEEQGPSVTHNADGSTISTTGGRSFRLVNVEHER